MYMYVSLFQNCLFEADLLLLLFLIVLIFTKSL